MATGFGHKAWTGFGEHLNGSGPAAPTEFVEILEESLSGKQQFISRPCLGGFSQRNKVKSKKTVEGGFKFQFPWEGAELILSNAFGQVIQAGIGPVFTDTFQLVTNQNVSLTLQVNRDAASVGSAFRYEDCQISKLTLTQTAEDFLTCAVEVVGGNWGNVAVATPTFQPFIGVDWEHARYFNLASLTQQIFAEEFEITIENLWATDRFILGSRIRKGLGRGGVRKISGKILAEFENLTAYNHFLSLDETDLTGTWIGPDNRQMVIYCPKVVFSGEDPQAKDGGPIKAPLTFEAFQFATANDECTITLDNYRDLS